jgi:hypothetical protein
MDADRRLAVLRAIDTAFFNLRGRVCLLLPLHDSFLEQLVSAGILTNFQRYLIFSSPRPTVYSNIRRGITFLRILNQFFFSIDFVRFLRNITPTNFTESDYLSIQEFLLYLDTEFSNSDIITNFYRNNPEL